MCFCGCVCGCWERVYGCGCEVRVCAWCVVCVGILCVCGSHVCIRKCSCVYVGCECVGMSVFVCG